MRPLFVLSLILATASSALAQDTVIVRHVAPPQDTAVVVRHLAPPQDSPPLVRRIPVPPYAAGAPRSQLFLVPPRDPGYGTLLSVLFPGGGQFYAGAETKGMALMLLGYGAPIIGIASSETAPRFRNNGYSGQQCYQTRVNFVATGESCRNGYDGTDAAIGIGVGVTAWIYGIATAGTDVGHWNQAHGVRFIGTPGRVGLSIPFP